MELKPHFTICISYHLLPLIHAEEFILHISQILLKVFLFLSLKNNNKGYLQ